MEKEIEEILIEASAYGLRDEVKFTAAKIMKETECTELQAYIIAFDEWIK